MESTGSYWKPVYNIFEEEQIPIMVVNAQHIKGVPGRKTDVKDAEWIADLVRHGLVKASYIPNRDIIWFQITPMVSDLLLHSDVCLAAGAFLSSGRIMICSLK